MVRSLAFSFSTSQTDTSRFGTYKPGTGLAGGLRLCLIEYKTSNNKILDSLLKETQKRMSTDAGRFIAQDMANSETTIENLIVYLQNKLQNKKADYSKEFQQQAIQKIISLKDSKIIEPSIFTDSMRAFLVRLRDNTSNIRVNNITLVDSLSRLPDGFRLDINMAYFGVLPGNNIKTPESGAFSIWLVPSYKIQPKKANGISIDLMLLARLTLNHKKNDSTYIDIANYWDLGGKAAISIGKFNLNGEAIYRVASKLENPFTILNRNTWRITATASYKFTNYLSLQITFGRNFDGKSVTFDKVSNGSLYYNAGFNFGLTALSEGKSKSK